MSDGLDASAGDLHLRAVDGGYEPEEGWELSILVRGGVEGLVTVGPVRRIITRSDCLILSIEASEEVIWLRWETVAMATAKRTSSAGTGKRTGFS